MVAALLMNLADVYVAEGKYTEAEPLYTRACHTRRELWTRSSRGCSRPRKNGRALAGDPTKGTSRGL
ncbi:MAG TPA: tetratricopeptide repeat protein [Ktedonobacteraceae bacterium]